MKVVNAYLRGEGGYGTLAERFGITSPSIVEHWVKNYRERGEQGLRHNPRNKKYTFEDKLAVVKSYLTGETTYRELAYQFEVLDPVTIWSWVKAYRTHGVSGLKPKRKGAPVMPRKPKLVQVHQGTDEVASSDETKKRLRELEEENLNLRIELAYLKILRGMDLEEPRVKNTPQESSTSSEETSR